MTTYKMGWLDRVTKISFPNAQGLCFVSVGYGVASDQSAPPSISASLSGLPYGGDYDLLSEIKDGPKPGTATGNGTSVSAAMKAGLFQWSAGTLYNKLSTTGFGPQRIYYVATADGAGGAINATNYLDPFFGPHGNPGIDQCGTHLQVIGAYGGTVFNCNQPLIGEAVFAGFDPTRIVHGQGFNGQFDNLADAQYFAAAFNATFFQQHSTGLFLTVGSFIATPPGTLFVREERVNFVLNTGLIKTKKLGSADTFTFTVNVDGDPNGRTSLGASMTKASGFPLDGKNKPTFAGFPQVTATDSGSSISITGTIDTKAQTVTF